MITDSDKYPTPQVNDHPSAGEMAAYVDGVVTHEERQHLENHLSECARCRAELVVVREATRSKPSRLRWVAGAAATAAAIALLLLTPAMIDDAADPVLRGPDAADPAAGTTNVIAAVAPREMTEVAPEELRFVWRSAGPDAQYRLTITTEAGDPVASITTADTIVTSLEDAELAPDTEYFWWVEALRADRATAESRLLRFRTAP